MGLIGSNGLDFVVVTLGTGNTYPNIQKHMEYIEFVRTVAEVHIYYLGYSFYLLTWIPLCIYLCIKIDVQIFEIFSDQLCSPNYPYFAIS